MTSLSLLEQGLVLVAGLAAGAINTIVGSGTLVTFPILILLGVPPVQANVSNTVGLVTGSISGAVGYRRELVGQAGRVVVLGVAGGVGGLVGGLLLLRLPAAAFDAVVPILIIAALVAMVVQPRMARRVARSRALRADDRATGNGHAGSGDHAVPGSMPPPSSDPTTGPAPVTPILWLAIMLTGVYGGYFGAAQGVLLLALLGIMLGGDLQRLNAVKNVIGSVVNGVAAILFVVVADVDWVIAGLIAVGAIIGGQVGARVARRMRPAVLRTAIIVVGVVAVVRLVS